MNSSVSVLHTSDASSLVCQLVACRMAHHISQSNNNSNPHSPQVSCYSQQHSRIIFPTSPRCKSFVTDPLVAMNRVLTPLLSRIVYLQYHSANANVPPCLHCGPPPYRWDSKFLNMLPFRTLTTSTLRVIIQSVIIHNRQSVGAY